MEGPMARPSRPSVRFTALDAATMTNMPKGTYNQPRSGVHSLMKGMISLLLYDGLSTSSHMAMKATRICPPNLALAEMPLFLW